MKRFTTSYDTEHGLHLEWYLPDTESKTVFIYFHGGGLESGSRLFGEKPFSAMAEDGYAVVSADYRLYPTAHYPDFVCDAARAVACVLNDSGYSFEKIFVGGSSAGSYLSMMLLFDPSYLGKYGLCPLDFDGWLLDAGQPTVHFNVLRERGLDTRLVRIDETSALWHIQNNFHPTRGDGKFPLLLTLSATYDLPCRTEQLRLLHATLLHFGWSTERLKYIFMKDYRHCEYNNHPIFFEIIRHLIDETTDDLCAQYTKDTNA